ncbi:hypothetical protein BDP27DRAFT_1203156, partial [Rhodocollybia butyracea]
DHLQRRKFELYAAEHAKSWYDHVINGLGREACSLYLITGYDKARAWGVSSFDGAEEGSVSMDFVPRWTQGSSMLEYWFRKCDSAESSSGADNTYGNQSGCVFLRGLRIAIRESFL